MKRATISIGIFLVSFMILAAIIGPHLSPWGFDTYDLANKFAGPSLAHPFGLDENGRDILTRTFYGARVSLAVGISVVLLACISGVIVGIIAGYFGGIYDRIFVFISDVFLAFPGILLAIAIAAVVRPSIFNVVMVLSVVGWVGYARLVRGQVLSIKEREYVASAISVGVRKRRIFILYIIPNLAGPLMVQATFGMAGVILAESTLSFLGLGVPVTTPSWGAMLDSGVRYLLIAPHISIFPGLALALTVLGFNFLGDGLRDKLDPKTGR